MGDESKSMVVVDSAMQPTSFQELRALAKDAADSKFFGASSPPQALMLMMAGRDLGMTYTQSLRAFHIIEGKPALSAAGMVAVCKAHKDVCEEFRTLSVDNTQATVLVKRTGEPERTVQFTIEDAHRAGLVKEKSNWVKYPSRMCLARAQSFAAKEVFPELLMGLYDPDEIEPRQAPTFRVVDSKSPAQQAPVSEERVADADVVDESVVEGETIAMALANRINEATTPPAMKELAAEISQLAEKGSLTDEEKGALKVAWTSRRDALKGAA